MHPRTEQLKSFMSSRGMSAEDVGRILNRRPQLVRQWRCESPVIPEHSLELLILKATRDAN